MDAYCRRVQYEGVCGGCYFLKKYLCEECASGLMVMGCCAHSIVGYAVVVLLWRVVHVRRCICGGKGHVT